ncbi:hypothetical protein PCA20602_02233 [Pandoraea capi]|uniref:Uncharacterized protein n=1 Tax=Pandoraea capi TaxID=2508286 RepID=A0ABY6VZK1_9BURK|nr:hypothetical protein [Pandoraea capi]VVE02983.1 hypothetical protein PCA20602_02233 [Pandoraea capi]
MTVKRKALLRTDNKAASLNVPATQPSGEEDPSFQPTPPIIDPNALADRENIPDNVYPFNIVKATFEGQPINFTAPIEAHYTLGYRTRYYVDGVSDGVEGSIGQPDLDAGFFTIGVQPTLLTHGMHTLTYGVKPEFDPDWGENSVETYFTLDFEEPENLGEGEVPVEAENGLTDQILTNLGNVLEVTLPSWGNQFYLDKIVGIIRQVGGADHTIPEVKIPYPYDFSDPVVLEFPRALLEQVGDGILEITYKITDLAGNESDEAFVKLIDVFIQGGIDDLEPPEVPLHEDDDLIVEEDARTPVVVRIPGHASVEPGFTIVVLWGSRALDGVVFNGDNTQPFMLDVEVPYGVVAAEWNENKDAEEYADIDVNYVVYGAGGREVGRPDTATPVRVNLSQAGGEDPDEETPENEALGAPIVRHSAWQAGERENYIPDASVQVDHTIVIPWFVRAADGTITDQHAFLPGDKIIFMYDGVAAGEYTIANQDVVNEIDLERALLWQTVEAAGSGEKDVQYIVERTLIPDGQVNTSLSPPTAVEVEDTGDLPGGGEPLDDAYFNDAVITWRIVVEHGGFAPMTVPLYANQEIGDRVRVHVLCNAWASGQPDGAPLPDAEWGGPDEVNEVPGFDFETIITDRNAGADLTFAWPQAVLVNAYPLARARIQYSVSRNDGSGTVTSNEGGRHIVELGNMPNPPQPAGTQSVGSRTVRRHRPTLAEALAGVGRSPEARQAALNAYVRAWRTTSSQRRAFREYKQEREAQLLKLSKTEHRIDDPLQRKLAEIAARPTPDPFKKE